MLRLGSLLLTLMLVMLPLPACSRRQAPATEINLVMTDYLYKPNQLLVPPGQNIVLHLTNEGAVEHEFVIMKYGTTVGQSFGSEDEENIYWEIEMKPGETVTVTFTSPEQPGTYQFVCGIEGHFTAGMAGTLQVATP
ncbi:MAG: cupredoxin domain-containing protein [Chloroflexus sp.]